MKDEKILVRVQLAWEEVVPTVHGRELPPISVLQEMLTQFCQDGYTDSKDTPVYTDWYAEAETGGRKVISWNVGNPMLLRENTKKAEDMYWRVGFSVPPPIKPEDEAMVNRGIRLLQDAIVRQGGILLTKDDFLLSSRGFAKE